MWAHLPSLRALAAWVAATVAVLVLGALIVSWSGLYNVAVTSGHWPITRWFLEFSLRNSVATQSLFIKPPPLDDPSLIRLGAGHFAGGCAPCHGAPGQQRNPITLHMLPAPPMLSQAVPSWDRAELFWIVRNGLKYSGMPSWVAPEREDEVWAVVAFLRTMPGLSIAEYQRLAHGNVEAGGLTALEIARAGSGISALTACARCHEGAGSHPTSALVPILAGQKPEYLARALRDYAAGTRLSGIMQPVAAELDGEEINRLAAYYANLPASRSSHAPAGVGDASRKDIVETGRKIANEGVPSEGIPPCLTCHGQDRSTLFPRLAGQHAAYMAGQLRVWKSGLRDATVPGRIMATVARRLSDDRIQAVAAYFASLEAAPRGALERAGQGALR